MKQLYLTLLLSAGLTACGGSSGGGGADPKDPADNIDLGGNTDLGYGTTLQNQSKSIQMNDTVEFYYLANKIVNPDDIVMVTEPQHGGESMYADHFLYRPYTDFVGSDSFSYKLCNSDDECTDTATLSITITAQAPTEYGTVLSNQTINITPGSSINISYVADKNVDYRDIELVTPTRGTVLVEPNYFTYTADNSTIPDYIDYRLCNADGLCTDPARITIIIADANDSYPNLSVTDLSDVSKDGNVIIHSVLNFGTFNLDYYIYDNAGTQQSTPLLVNQSGDTIVCGGTSNGGKEVDMDLNGNKFAVLCTTEDEYDTLTVERVFYYDRNSKVLTDLVEMTGDIAPESDSSRADAPFISDDGSTVIFYSNYDSINLSDGDSHPGIFKYDVASGVRTRIIVDGYVKLLYANSDVSKAILFGSPIYGSYELAILDIETGNIVDTHSLATDDVPKVKMTDDATKLIALLHNSISDKYELKAFDGNTFSTVLEIENGNIDLDFAMDKTAENVVLRVLEANTLGKEQGLYKVNIATKQWTLIAATEEGNVGLFTDFDFTKTFSNDYRLGTFRVDAIN